MSPLGPGTKMLYHYVFIESESSPSTDPVLLWSNGGPGASSMFGSLSGGDGDGGDGGGRAV